MFDAPFEQLFKAVDRVRVQLETATEDLKPYLAQELVCLQQLGETVIDRWMMLDEHIQELMDTHGLYNLNTSCSTFVPVDVRMASRTDRRNAGVQPSTSNPQHAEIHNVYIEEADATDMTLAEVVFSWSDNAVVQFRRGLAFFDLLMWDEAVAALGKALETTPSPIIRLYMAAALASKGQGHAALGHIRQVLEHSDERALAAAAREVEAQVWLMENQMERAAECFEAVARLTPESTDAWFNLALARIRQNDLDEAAKALSATLSQSPDDPEAWQLMVLVTRALRGPQVAMQYCLQGLDFTPSDKRLRLWKSKLLFELDNTATSTAIADRLADQHPEDTAVIAWSSWLCVSQGKADIAIGRLKKHLTLVQRDARALLQLGVTYLLAGEEEEAESILWAALPESTESSLIWIGLSAISYAKGDYVSAQKRAIRAIHDDRPAIRRLALYQYGRSLQGDHKHHEAETYLRAAHLLGQPNAAILDALADSAEHLGRPEEAKKRREQAQHLSPETPKKTGNMVPSDHQV